ncbi:MAG: TfuA-related McrA-glycine thioamidation protein [Thaumarchaeota archaeon]|nr:TfuA-related McrA-glycine thioamidation protein [Nitrososphaerota archaeon]
MFSKYKGRRIRLIPVIFLGPTLSPEKAKKIFSFADFRPPARKGDFEKLIKEDVQLIGFIDGVFLQNYPPTPIEVYRLLQKKNLTLAGAASLGALRAVELEKFGMIGIGKIFELYKKGIIDSDDEVAVTFSEWNYNLQSEALIDIRYTLYNACKDGIIDKETKKILVRTAKNIYFPYRNYDELFEKISGSIDENILEDIRNYVKTHRRSLKEEDAIRLIEIIKERYLELLK